MNMRSLIEKFGYLLVTIFILTSCQKDTFVEQTSKVDLTLVYPQIEEAYTVESIEVTLVEANSGASYTISPQALTDDKIETTLPFGNYIVSLDGEVKVAETANEKTYKVKAYAPDFTVNNATAALSLNVFLSDPEAKFVFKEIFFTGTVTPEQKSYNGDKYFVIYNNSTDTLFADGLFIAQSTFLTTSKVDYTPNKMEEGVTSSEVIMLPGKGSDYPILPGEEFVVANNAINHRELNPNSFDLSNAKFEIDLIGSINVDNPAVPNTLSLINTMTMHNRGFKSFVIGKLPEDVSPEDFQASSSYDYTYKSASGITMTRQGNLIPNEYIMDAVNLSVASEFQWLATSASLDMGWTYCGKTDKDSNRHGKSVIRKSLSTTTDGIQFLKDTNNSAEDFDAEQAASQK
ncbi:MAG: DUF4876 domain-containing protein [Sphingobacterium sp.]